MSKTDIRKELYVVVSKLFDGRKVVDDSTAIQGHIDSLDFMGLISEIEDVVTDHSGTPFALTDDVISGEDSPLKNLGSLVAYVEESIN